MKVNGDGGPIWLKELWEFTDPSLAVLAEEEKCLLFQLKSSSLISHSLLGDFSLLLKNWLRILFKANLIHTIWSPLQTDVSSEEAAQGPQAAPTSRGRSGPREQLCPSLWAQNLPQEQSPEVHVPQGEEGTEVSLPWLCVWANERNLASHLLIICFFFFFPQLPQKSPTTQFKIIQS